MAKAVADNIMRSLSDVTHMINDRALEIQRTNHSYLQFDLSDLVRDIHGDKLGYLYSNDNNNSSYDVNALLRIALESHGMPNQGSDSVITVRKGNEVIKFASGVSYEDVDISVTDFIGADIERLISAWDGLRYNPVTGIVNPAYKYKRTGHIIQYSPDGEIARSWILYGAWIDNVKYGDYDRSSAGDARKISFTLHVDKAYPEARS